MGLALNRLDLRDLNRGATTVGIGSHYWLWVKACTAAGLSPSLGNVASQPYSVLGRATIQNAMDLADSVNAVLDVGAWDGFFSFEFERRWAKRVLAIDTWTGPHALETFKLARQRFNSKVEYERLDVRDILAHLAAVALFNDQTSAIGPTRKRRPLARRVAS